MHYRSQVIAQRCRTLVSSLQSSVLFALSQALITCSMALEFWYGDTSVARHKYDLFRFLICFRLRHIRCPTTGYVFTFANDIGKAKQAAGELQMLFDKVPSIDTWSQDGLQLMSAKWEIEFRKAKSCYPTRDLRS